MSRTDRYPALSRFQPSALNLETTRRYAACELTGGHQPSGETVRRWFPGSDRELPICAICGIPYNAPRANWSSGTTVTRTKRGPKLPG